MLHSSRSAAGGAGGGVATLHGSWSVGRVRLGPSLYIDDGTNIMPLYYPTNTHAYRYVNQ